VAEPPAGPIESVHSPSAAAHISHAVIATYAAAAVRDVPGVHGIADGHLGPIERRSDSDRPPRGVRVSSDGERIGLELHLVAEWGTHLPELAAAVEQAVRRHLEAMIELRVSDVAVIVDDVVGPG
jgi:uncharacterized alkaline shock family protein YloU